MEQGQRFKHSFTVTSAVYKGFMDTFNDYNPLHTDTEFAMSKGFKGAVMHGNILNGFLSYFIGECLPDKNVIIYEQSIKYSLPVYLGNQLEFNGEITRFFESVNTFEFKFDFKNSEGKKVAKGTIQIGLLK